MIFLPFFSAPPADQRTHHVIKRAGAGVGPFLVEVDGQAEVSQLEHLVFGEEHILRLYVAVHNALHGQYNSAASGMYNLRGKMAGHAATC